MIHSIEESPLYRIANPRSIAFFGASNNLSLMGTNQFVSLLDLGYEGAIYPIHPRDREVHGIKAYRSVLDLPETPDLAIIVIPTRTVVQVMEECGRKGIKQAIIVSAGFKEMGAEGIDQERKLAEVASRYGIRFLGPNCIGVTNPYRKLNPTPFFYKAEKGFIGFASQSGSFVTQMFESLRGMGLGFSTAFSVGNAANIDLVDCMDYLAACPHTRVIGLYIEGISRGRAFVEKAREILPRKPIVAFYVGGSETGKKAGFSHTGAMAGPDPLYDGIFRQSGIIRANTITELFDFCWVLGSLPGPRGRRVALLTQSGGPGTAGADACGRAGLQLPPFSPHTLEKLAPFAPHTASLNNPIDLTFHKDPLHYFAEIPRLLFEDKGIDMLIVYFLMPADRMARGLKGTGLSQEKIAEEVHRLSKNMAEALLKAFPLKDKPMVGYTFQSFEYPLIQGLIKRGLPVFPEPDRAAKALRALATYSETRNSILEGHDPIGA